MIDQIIVFCYLIIVLIVGLYFRSKGNNFDIYGKVQGKLRGNILILMSTIFATSVGGGTIIGLGETIFTHDLAYVYGLLLAIPIDILLAVYIAPRLSLHYGKETVGDIMEFYYGSIGRYIGGISAVVISLGFIAMQINICASIFQYILKIDNVKTVILSYLIITIYTTIGGLKSVLFTNLLQFFMVVLTIPIITFAGINYLSWPVFIDSLPIYKILPSEDNNLIFDSIAALLSFSVMSFYPSLIQRYLINQEASKTKKAVYIKSIVYAILLIFITLNSLISYELYGNKLSKNAIFHLINDILPKGLIGLVIIGLLSAAMSTADADLNITALTLTKDLLKPIFNIKNGKIMLLIVRLSNISLGIFTVYLALSFNNVVDLLIFISGFWAPIILVPLLFSLYAITIKPKNFVITSLSGSFGFILWQIFVFKNNHHGLKPVFVGTVFSLLTFLLMLHKEKGAIDIASIDNNKL